MRILCVCTANICRSVTLAALLTDARAERPELAGLPAVRSAGTAAILGAPSCRVAPALRGRPEEHRSTPLSPEAVAWADLILTAARDHRSAVAALDPRARSRTFTVRQAGRLAAWAAQVDLVDVARERARWEATARGSGAPEPMNHGGPITAPAEERRPAAGHPAAQPSGASEWAARFAPGDPRGQVDPLPAEPGLRWAWLVAQLDAARGLVGVAREPVPPRGRFRRRRAAAVDPVDPDDVPDPHVLGSSLHAVVDEQLRAAVDALTGLMVQVVGEPAGM